MNTTLVIKYSDVLNEVNKTTSYETSKIVGEDGNRDAYERISTVDADEEMLRRFWNEARTELLNILNPFIAEYQLQVVAGYDEGEDEEITVPGLTITLQHTERTPLYGLGIAAQSFFVTRIISEWYAMCQMPERAAAMAASAQQHLAEVKNIIYNKRAPKR